MPRCGTAYLPAVFLEVADLTPKMGQPHHPIVSSHWNLLTAPPFKITFSQQEDASAMIAG